MLKKLGWLVVGVLLTACVTINVYFPAAATEEAARTIVRDVLDGTSQPPAASPADQGEKADKQQGKQERRYRPSRALVMVGTLLEMVVPAVQAAGAANIDINTSAIKKLRSAMTRRQASLRTYYQSGAIGFDQQGLVAIRDLGIVELKSRNLLKKWVADENNDRKALYREIARANNHAEWEADIRNTFARIWIDEAPAGYWYKTTKGWKKK